MTFLVNSRIFGNCVFFNLFLFLQMECISATTSDDYFATSSLHGNVVVWNMTRQVKVGVVY